MAYIGVRATGSVYGYRIERREYSDRVRARQERELADAGRIEWETGEASERRVGRRKKDPRKRARAEAQRHLVCQVSTYYFCRDEACIRARQAVAAEERAKALALRAQRERSDEVRKLLS